MIANKSRCAASIAAAMVAGLIPGISAYAATAQAPSRFTVVAQLSTHSVRAGHPATIGGSVAPARPGKKVYLQQGQLGTWKTIDATKLNGASEYSFTVTPRGSGTKYYRVLKPREGAVGRAASSVRKLNSYRWFRLDQLKWPLFDHFRFDSATISATQYAHALVSSLIDVDESEFAQASLDGRCTTMTGVWGLTDDSSQGAEAVLAVSGDATAPLYSATLVAGPGQRVTVDVRGDRRLLVGVTNETDTGTVPAIAQGRVLCAFDHAPMVL
jgi:hypothetical protein